LLVKVFATALALSQVTTRPDTVKTQFDPVQDQAEVVQLLGAGCDHFRKAFDIENINLDDLIDTVMTDTQAADGEIAAFRGVKFVDLHLAYRQFCKHETLERSVVDIPELIAFYNKAAADLPDHNRLKGLRLPGMTTVYDGNGAKFAELFEPDNRRRWVPLAEIPEHVQKAFIAAEDKRFYAHHGVDERSVIRAFINMVAEPGRRQGGSTITQQVAKNLLVGDEVSYVRKIREIIVAARIERTISKQEILEIYLNSIYLGRSSWGVDLAARAYFGRPAGGLTLTEGAFLAGLTKGPAYFNPDRHRERAQGRLAYVLSRMHDDETITADQFKQAQAERLKIVALQRPRRTTGFHLVDEIGREARAIAGVSSLTAHSYEVRSTIRPDLQRAAEAALQEGLAQYEQNSGRVEFNGAEANLADAVGKLQADGEALRGRPAWQIALEQVRLPLYDVHWDRAVVVEKKGYQGGFDSIRVGLRDGRVLPLSTWGNRTRGKIGLHDVVYVKVIEGKGKQSARVELRARPVVQGAAVVLENKTGRVLAMVGGFSYPLSQLNRVTQARRQPGSSLKPLTYLAALNAGLQPNTLVLDAPITYPPINGINRYSRARDWWSPRNYDGGYAGAMTLRRGLEQSKNLVTARLLSGGIADTPRQSLDEICRLAVEAHVYAQCVRFYPFVLGAQPVRPIDLAAFYAAIYNEGGRPTPHVIERITQDGREVYKAKEDIKFLADVDRAAMFQLRSILQGVVARGTARRMASLTNIIAGKTGTSDDFNDAWFVGFDNDVTIAVWTGYDNAKGKRTLGHGQAGSRVALPIFHSIMQAVWANIEPRSPLVGPSREAARHLVALPIDLHSGQRIEARGRGVFMEQFRLDASGRFTETQFSLVSRGYDYNVGDGDPNSGGSWTLPGLGGNSWSGRDYDGSPLRERAYRRDSWRRDDPRYLREPEPPPGDEAEDRPRPQRAVPNYLWRDRPGY
jgi:membrane carboxypeptidase/penicillin-binding protein